MGLRWFESNRLHQFCNKFDMAKTPIDVVNVPRSGHELTFTMADTVNGNCFLNDGRTLVCLNNFGATDVEVVFETTMKPDLDLTVTNRVVTVRATKVHVVGPFDPNVFNQLDGTVNFSSAGTVAVGIGSIG